MTWFNTTPIDVKARKLHRCSWCSERIERGEVYKRWVCIGDDGPMTCKMHQECHAAMERFAAAQPGEYEYTPGEFTRGCTCEAGDIGHGTYPDCVKQGVVYAA
jgi:hypothetical protein